MSQQHIQIQQPAQVTSNPIPRHYKFLKTPTLRRYRINFRHPAYPHDDNLLCRLYGWDHVQGGVHHGLAHNACAIFADNRFDGYLSTTCDGEHGERVKLGWDDVLPARDGNYYFFVPYPGADSTESPGTKRPPYQWPVVAKFQDWQFPTVMPDIWTRLTYAQGLASNLTTEFTLKSCRITAFESGLEIASLIPEQEQEWFLTNSMDDWNEDNTLEDEEIMDDIKNAVVLRSDMHKAFMENRFVFFPKYRHSFVLPMLEPMTDVGQLYHNTRMVIPHCGLEFLFVRFAMSMFPFLEGFFRKSSKSCVRYELTINDPVEDTIDTVEDVRSSSTDSVQHAEIPNESAIVDDESLSEHEVEVVYFKNQLFPEEGFEEPRIKQFQIHEFSEKGVREPLTSQDYRRMELERLPIGQRISNHVSNRVPDLERPPSTGLERYKIEKLRRDALWDVEDELYESKIRPAWKRGM